MRYLIKNASIIDPARRVATIGSVLIEEGRVTQVIDHADLAAIDPTSLIEGAEVINARGAVVAPGFTDLHVHLREPGEEHKETIASGTQAAARGGFTTVCAMPDTLPATDSAAVVRQVRDIARRRGVVSIDLVGAVTQGRAGKQLTEMAELVEAGCFAFGDAAPVADPAVMRHAMEYAAMLDVPILCHCEDTRLNRGWAMHEGATALRLGLPGYPAIAEESMIARDIMLAEQTGARIHICHVSTAGGVAQIRTARERGLRITADVTPHHLTLSDRWTLGWLAPPLTEESATRTGRRSRKQEVEETGLNLLAWLNPSYLPPYHPATRINPPLRTEEDCAALVEGLRDGSIDAIASDHSPHSQVEKDCEYRLAAPGISGLETALGLTLTLVHRGKLDLVDLVARFTEGPARLLDRLPSTLRPGSWADIVIFDPEYVWSVEPAQFASKGKHTPLVGQRLKGAVMLTMHRGKIVFRRGNFGAGTGTLQQPARLEGILDAEPEEA